MHTEKIPWHIVNHMLEKIENQSEYLLSLECFFQDQTTDYYPISLGKKDFVFHKLNGENMCYFFSEDGKILLHFYANNMPIQKIPFENSPDSFDIRFSRAVRKPIDYDYSNYFAILFLA